MSAIAPVAVLGAGIGGLVAARQLARHGVPMRVFEGGKQIAGMAVTHTDPDGFSYDVGGHFITNRLSAALGVSGSCRTVRHYGEVVRLGEDYHQYPFGLMRVPRYVQGALAARVRHPSGPILSAADRFRHDYGRAMADEVAIPLVEAWSGESATTLAASVADKIPQSLVETVRLRLAAKGLRRAVAIGYCGSKPQSASVYHVYPEHGVATVCQAMADELGDAVALESPVEKIYVSEGRAVGVRVAGEDLEASAVVSTAPINVLPKLVEGTDALAGFGRFRFRPMLMINLKLDGEHLLRDTMVWLPRDFPFFRLTEATQSMPWLAPPGKTLVLAEIGSSRDDPRWGASDDELIDLCLDALEPMVAGIRSRYLGRRVLRQPLAYPVFSLDYEADRQRLEHDGTGIPNLLSIGRNGEFDHILMEDIYWRTLARIEAWVASESADRRAVA
jgi:protoporphyrinogen oxidase